ICAQPRFPVGASLLAKTAAHSTLIQPDPPLSRAGSLPHFALRHAQHLRTTEIPCGSGLAREDASTFTINVA
ncbi:hypothetical protein QEP27_20715, partial [Pseudomonas nunensis]|nr:hypothetical protein [Pseudomonas nunensis]